MLLSMYGHNVFLTYVLLELHCIHVSQNVIMVLVKIALVTQQVIFGGYVIPLRHDNIVIIIVLYYQVIIH